jgi:H+/Cl- antiporter ClcA
MRPRGVVIMLLMAIAVGAVAGVGAWGFRMLIGLVHNVGFLGRFAFEYDANVFTPVGPWGVGVVLVPVAGALVVAWLVKNYAPEAKGHGVPEVMAGVGAPIAPPPAAPCGPGEPPRSAGTCGASRRRRTSRRAAA